MGFLNEEFANLVRRPLPKSIKNLYFQSSEQYVKPTQLSLQDHTEASDHVGQEVEHGADDARGREQEDAEPEPGLQDFSRYNTPKLE
jgi:hypothetical protein